MVKIGFGMKLLILVIFSNQIIFSLVFESRSLRDRASSPPSCFKQIAVTFYVAVAVVVFSVTDGSGSGSRGRPAGRTIFQARTSMAETGGFSAHMVKLSLLV